MGWCRPPYPTCNGGICVPTCVPVTCADLGVNCGAYGDGVVPGGMRVGFVVAGELPRERETILVRLMAGGAALTAAVADLAGLPADAYERVVASAEVVELRQMLGQKSRKTKQEETFIVNTRDAFEQLKEEGRSEANARAVLTVLRVRGIAVPDAARERILAERDPARLERWHERAILAASIAEVLDEPS